MKQKLKSTKGITLVALVTTLIILLILAMVSIASISDSNIIKHAQNGKNDYKQAQNNEAQTLAEYENYLDENNPKRSDDDWIYLDAENMALYIGDSTEITLTKNTEITMLIPENMELNNESWNITISENKINKKLDDVETIYLYPIYDWNIFKNDTLLKKMLYNNSTIKKLSADYETEKKITLPKSLREYALLDTTEYSANKDQWDSVGEVLEKFTLPDTLETIKANGMIYFTNVKELKIPTLVKNVGKGAFSGWSAEQKINITGCDTSGWDANWKEGCNAIIIGQ